MKENTILKACNCNSEYANVHSVKLYFVLGTTCRQNGLNTTDKVFGEHQWLLDEHQSNTSLTILTLENLLTQRSELACLTYVEVPLPYIQVPLNHLPYTEVTSGQIWPNRIPYMEVKNFLTSRFLASKEEGPRKFLLT